jgi:hypothetical protein
MTIGGDEGSSACTYVTTKELLGPLPRGVRTARGWDRIGFVCGRSQDGDLVTVGSISRLDDEVVEGGWGGACTDRPHSPLAPESGTSAVSELCT